MTAPKSWGQADELGRHIAEAGRALRLEAPAIITYDRQADAERRIAGLRRALSTTITNLRGYYATELDRLAGDLDRELQTRILARKKERRRTRDLVWLKLEIARHVKIARESVDAAARRELEQAED